MLVKTTHFVVSATQNVVESAHKCAEGAKLRAARTGGTARAGGLAKGDSFFAADERYYPAV